MLIPVEVSARYFIAGDVPYILVVSRAQTEQRHGEALLKMSYERKKRNDILNELVKGNHLAKERVQEMMLGAGLKLQAPINCFLLLIDECQEKPREYWQEHFEELRSLQDSIILGLEDCEEWVTWVSSEGIGVLHFGSASKNGMREQNELAERLRLEVKKRVPTVKLEIGIAEVAAEITELAERYRQSCIAVRMGGKIWPERRTYHYLDLGVFQLISFIEDQEQVVDYIERMLGKLLCYQRQKGEEYLLTLEVILESHSLKDAAKKIFIHQKTIELRKRRIEEILGVSLSSFETRMALATAIKLMKLDAWKLGAGKFGAD
jgi:sugar diacid utilization regulator